MLGSALLSLSLPKAADPAQVLWLYTQRNPSCRQLSCFLPEGIAEFALEWLPRNSRSHDSMRACHATSLHLWFYAVYLMTSTRFGISVEPDARVGCAP
jgi:hypothetical protein